MRFLLVNIEEVFREAAARWTLLAYFFLSSLFILIFALAVNLDIVDGALAGAKLFGRELDIAGERVDMDRLVMGFEGGFSGFLFLVGTFLAVFATAHLMPRLQDKGTIDLYLSKPTGRVPLLLSRYVAGLVLASANVLYLVGSIWLIVIWKTGVVHPRFLLGAAVIIFSIAALMSFSFLIGAITASTAVSIMTTYAVFFFSAILVTHDRIEAAVDSIWSARLVHVLYMIFPKTAELGRALIALVAGDMGPRAEVQTWLTPAPFVSTAIFTVVCLALSSWVFTRKEY